jgi:hypothetical protein
VRATTAAAATTDRSFEFIARLERLVRGVTSYSVLIPAAVSKAIARRGHVPVVAMISHRVEVRASIVPCGNGRHRLQLNATTRTLANARPGDRLSITLAVDPNPTALSTPADLSRALSDEGSLEAYESFPVGKRNHIVAWIEQAVADTTRAKRIAKAVEVAAAARERRMDRTPRR